MQQRLPRQLITFPFNKPLTAHRIPLEKGSGRFEPEAATVSALTSRAVHGCMNKSEHMNDWSSTLLQMLAAQARHKPKDLVQRHRQYLLSARSHLSRKPVPNIHVFRRLQDARFAAWYVNNESPSDSKESQGSARHGYASVT